MSNGLANIDSKILKALEASTCFGIAHDDTVPECRQCDVKAQCKARSEGANIPIPTKKPVKEVPKVTQAPKAETKPTTTKASTAKPSAPSKPATKADKPAPKTSSGNVPNFKDMSLDQLKELAKEKNVEWKDYGHENITRMRLIMALKKAYE